MNYSPLRYPGGKKRLSAFIAKLCLDNDINDYYIEPFCGGASVGLFLLIEGFVKEITINDKDRSIFAFWYSVLNYTNELSSLIKKTNINIDEWKKQKEVQRKKEDADLLELGFSTLFLNRTNRSGIINAGPIGGMEQKGKYKLDCRFNKEDILNRIKLISNYRQLINLYNEDIFELFDEHFRKKYFNNKSVIYLDPPYYNKASSLYLNHFKNQDHILLKNEISCINNMHWLISYDNVPEIREMYDNTPYKEYDLKHTAYKNRKGKEILYFSPLFVYPAGNNLSPLNYKFVNGNIKTIV